MDFHEISYWWPFMKIGVGNPNFVKIRMKYQALTLKPKNALNHHKNTIFKLNGVV
jgi:hypothetical protein